MFQFTTVNNKCTKNNGLYYDMKYYFWEIFIIILFLSIGYIAKGTCLLILCRVTNQLFYRWFGEIYFYFLFLLLIIWCLLTNESWYLFFEGVCDGRTTIKYWFDSF
jgi:hypothetical protein